jgi:hypothetical protein
VLQTFAAVIEAADVDRPTEVPGLPDRLYRHWKLRSRYVLLNKSRNQSQGSSVLGGDLRLLLLLLLLLLKPVANPFLCAAALASVDTLAAPSPLVGGLAVAVITFEGIVEWHRRFYPTSGQRALSNA